jgi:hypothetical protein
MHRACPAAREHTSTSWCVSWSISHTFARTSPVFCSGQHAVRLSSTRGFTLSPLQVSATQPEFPARWDAERLGAYNVDDMCLGYAVTIDKGADGKASDT